MSPALLVSNAALRIPLPLIVASAGACGAMLTITLLHPTELILEPGRVLVVHDPLGLTGDRLLAHVYREVAHRQAASAEPGEAVATSLRWLIARPPLALVWDAVDALGRRSWRLAPGRALRAAASSAPASSAAPERQTARETERRAERRTSRVAEPTPRTPATHRESASAVLIISEAERPDALSPQSAARLLARAVRRDWAVLAATREGPVPAPPIGQTPRVGPERQTASASHPSAYASGNPRGARDWCTHVVCQGGVLRPVASR